MFIFKLSVISFECIILFFNTNIGNHDGIVDFLETYKYSSKNLIVDTRFMQLFCARHFCIKTKMSKEQQIDETFIIMM